MSVTQELPGKGRKLRPLRFVSFIHCFAWKRSVDSFTGCPVSCLLVWEHKQRACHFPHCMRRQCFVLWTRFTQVFLKLSWQFGRMLSIFGFPWPLIPFTYLLYSKVISKGSIRVETKTKQTSDCTKRARACACAQPFSSSPKCVPARSFSSPTPFYLYPSESPAVWGFWCALCLITSDCITEFPLGCIHFLMEPHFSPLWLCGKAQLDSAAPCCIAVANTITHSRRLQRFFMACPILKKGSRLRERATREAHRTGTAQQSIPLTKPIDYCLCHAIPSPGEKEETRRLLPSTYTRVSEITDHLLPVSKGTLVNAQRQWRLAHSLH